MIAIAVSVGGLEEEVVFCTSQIAFFTQPALSRAPPSSARTDILPGASPCGRARRWVFSQAGRSVFGNGNQGWVDPSADRSLGFNFVPSALDQDEIGLKDFAQRALPLSTFLGRRLLGCLLRRLPGLLRGLRFHGPPSVASRHLKAPYHIRARFRTGWFGRAPTTGWELA
jgi:hypothetical protein